jgi:hypothetical protein
VCRLTPFGSFRRRHSAATDAETESGFNGVPSGFAKYQIQILAEFRPTLMDLE